MSTTLQLVVVGVAVAAAAAYILRATWKAWFGAKPGCGSGCGKCGTASPEPNPPGRKSLPMA